MSIENLIPPFYLEIANCILEIDHEKFDAAASTTNGKLLAFHRLTVVDYCDIENNDVKNISLFCTYSPSIVYYFLLQTTDESLIAVTTEPSLQVYKKFSDVSSMVVGDFWQIGSPQLKLKFSNDSELITDLVSELSPSNKIQQQYQSDFTNSLNNNLRHIMSRIFVAERELMEKVVTRKTIISKLFDNYDNLDPVGGKSGALLIGTVKKKLFNHRWCILVPVQNKSNSTLWNAHVSVGSNSTELFSSETYRVKWFLLVQPLHSGEKDRGLSFGKLPSFENKVDTLIEVTNAFIHPYKQYYIVISFPFVGFVRDNVISVYPSVFYSLDDSADQVNLWTKVPRINLNIINLQHSEYKVFPDKLKGTVYDILAITATAIRTQYNIISSEILLSSMTGILIQFGFFDIGLANYFYLPAYIYDDILIRLEQYSPTRWAFDAYAVSQDDHVNFLRELYGKLPANTKIELAEFNVADDKEITRNINKFEKTIRSMIENYKSNITAADQLAL